ncbi:uncharacterized protein LOC117337719 [Pecten maximus]|uniref:uncharacterized protein LOC117337719 n=1 Tax=Pecten maximus TaxID=6579 RepID=UPI0014588F21|nr:uncharacterized protein LOC117337719 [Pecten maximus]
MADMTLRRISLLLAWMVISFGLAAGETDSKTVASPESSRNISPSVSDLMKRLDEMERRHDDDVSILQRRIGALESQHASDVRQMGTRDNKINSLENQIKHLNGLVSKLIGKQKWPVESLNNASEDGRKDDTFDTHQESNSMDSRGTDPDSQSRIARVATPVNNGIGFHAILGHVLENPGLGQAIPFRNVITNIGNAYSSNTGIFHCTQTGVYFFSFTLSLSTNERVDGHINRNGQMISATTCGNDSHWSSCTGTAVVELSEGDEVWVVIVVKHQSSVHLEPVFSLFSGFLLTYS